MINDKEKR